jgi:hypothetical protein
VLQGGAERLAVRRRLLRRPVAARHRRPARWPAIGAIAVTAHHVAIVVGFVPGGVVTIFGNHYRRVGADATARRRILAFIQPRKIRSRANSPRKPRPPLAAAPAETIVVGADA